MHCAPVTSLSLSEDQLIISGSSLGSIAIAGLSSDQRVATLRSTDCTGHIICLMYPQFLHMLFFLCFLPFFFNPNWLLSWAIQLSLMKICKWLLKNFISSKLTGIKTLCYNPCSHLVFAGTTAGYASCWDLRYANESNFL